MERAVEAALAAADQQAVGQYQHQELDLVPPAHVVQPVVIAERVEAERRAPAVTEQSGQRLRPGPAALDHQVRGREHVVQEDLVDAGSASV